MSKTLIAYFSHDGYNYFDGSIVDLPVGNTAIVADKIQIATGFDIFRIETVKPYPIDYSETVSIARKEKDNNERPLLKNQVNLDDYDTIILGYPNWCGTIPMAVGTFLESGSFDNKTIYPFCTHEGGEAGTSQRDINRLCPNSTVITPLTIKGSHSKNSDHKINHWLKYYTMG